MAEPPTLLHALLGISACAIYLALARLDMSIVPPGQKTPLRLPWHGLALLCFFTPYVGLCWTGLALVVAQKLGWLRGRVEVGAWLLVSLGLMRIASCVIHLLPPPFIFSQSALALAAACFAWTVPTLSRRLPRTGKYLVLWLLAMELLWRVPAMYLAPQMSVPWQQQLLGRTRWLIHWPCTVLGVATFLAQERQTLSRGWLHLAGLTCLMLEDFLLLWL